MFFFRTEGGMGYVALEAYENGFICMGSENRGTEDEPIYYFDGRYTDHMIESSMLDQFHVFEKRSMKPLLKRLGIRDRADVYSCENTLWIVKKI